MNRDSKKCRRWLDKWEGEGKAHLEDCEDCRAAHKLLALGRRDEKDHGVLPAPDELTERRLVDAVLASANDDKDPAFEQGVATGATRRKVLIAGAASAAAGIVFWFVVSYSPATVDNPVSPDTTEQDFRTAPTLAGARFARVTGDVKTGQISHSNSASLPLETPIRSRDGSFVFTLPSEIAISVAAHSEIEVTSDSKNRLTVIMTRGRALYSVTPGIDRPGFRITTNIGEIHVLGTVFTVTTDENETQVVVHRGTVEARPRNGKTVRVHTSQSFDMPAKKLLPADSAANAAMRPVVRELVELELGDHLRSLLEADVPKNEFVEDTDDPSLQVSPRAKSATPSLKTLMDKARRAKSQRKWQAAAKAYSQILSHYPGSDDANTVRVSLGQLLLERMSRPRAALSHLNRYLRGNPRGPLVPEALYNSSRCQRLLGNRAAEKRLLEQLITRYPKGLHAGSSTERLKELEQ